MPNFIEIGLEIMEKSQHAGGCREKLKRIIKKKEKTEQKQKGLLTASGRP